MEDHVVLAMLEEMTTYFKCCRTNAVAGGKAATIFGRYVETLETIRARWVERMQKEGEST